jgi:hypothetical protein
MPEHGHGHQHGPPDTSKGYEQSDLQITGIVKGVVGYFIFTALVGVFVLVLFIVFHQNDQTQADMGPTRVPSQPYPLLQNDVTAHTDIWNLRQNEQYLLDNVTYVDKSKGILRIPIEDAIDQEAAKGPNGQPQAGPKLPGLVPPVSHASNLSPHSPTRTPKPGTEPISLKPAGNATKITGGKK